MDVVVAAVLVALCLWGIGALKRLIRRAAGAAARFGRRDRGARR